jgi:hypothetical protein
MHSVERCFSLAHSVKGVMQAMAKGIFTKSSGIGQHNTTAVLAFLPNRCVGIPKNPAYHASHLK